jgi:hypothetical protein
MKPRKPVTTYQRHGLVALKRQVKLRGYTAIDMRTAAARELFAWRKGLIQDLGGKEQVSVSQMTLIEVAVRTRMYLAHIDGWLTEQSTLIDKRAKTVIPALKDRQALADSLSRTLNMLGLERKRVPTASLASRLSQA